MVKQTDHKKKYSVEFKSSSIDKNKFRAEPTCVKIKLEKHGDLSEKKIILGKVKENKLREDNITYFPVSKVSKKVLTNSIDEMGTKVLKRKQMSESSTNSKQSDSITSVIPVITISTTESDDEMLRPPKLSNEQQSNKNAEKTCNKQELAKQAKRISSELKSLRRQSSVESINENKASKEKKNEEGHKYQYSL